MISYICIDFMNKINKNICDLTLIKFFNRKNTFLFF